MSPSTSVKQYLSALPVDRKEAMNELVKIIRNNLPNGFEECINYGMPSWVVPHTIYPPGYHVDPKRPLPFLSVASQKSHIAIYHMGIYASEELMAWFVATYPSHCKTKLNMGKSCIRFKNPRTIPFALIAQVCSKMTPEAWIELYEAKVARSPS